MLWAIDIGNSTTKVGVWDAGNLTLRLTAPTEHGPEAFSDVAKPHALAIACVVPGALSAWLEFARRAECYILSAASQALIPVAYETPESLGADRLANAIAAVHLAGAPVITVDFGTATNIEVVDADGRFRGGAILPGLQITRDALLAHAKMIPEFPLTLPKHSIGRNTMESLQSGLVLGHLEAADGLIERMASGLSTAPEVIATGGWSGLMSSVSRTITRVETNLCLIGLRLAFESRSSPSLG